jgi:hypothetical protein
VGFILNNVVPRGIFPGLEEARVFSCDYNGWSDMPEAEREAIEAFDLAQEALSVRLLPRERRRLAPGSPSQAPRQKAA